MIQKGKEDRLFFIKFSLLFASYLFISYTIPYRLCLSLISVMLFSLNKDVSDGPDGHVAIIRTETAHVSTRRVACWKTTDTKTDSGVGGCAVVFLVAYDVNSYF